MSAPRAVRSRLILEAGRAHRQYWRDLWRYRELFFILAWRDVSGRYKQTVIGVAGAILRPILAMVVFSVVFGKLAKLPSDGELHTRDQLWQLNVAIEAPPGALRGFYQLENHGEHGATALAASRLSKQAERHSLRLELWHSALAGIATNYLQCPARG